MNFDVNAIIDIPVLWLSQTPVARHGQIC